MTEFDSKISECVENPGEDMFTESFRAGRRTYFFDVKSSRNSEYYITITESKRKLLKNNKMVYEKHHIYLYKEDFAKFAFALEKVLNYIEEKQPSLEANLPTCSIEDSDIDLLTPVLSFEDLED